MFLLVVVCIGVIIITLHIHSRWSFKGGIERLGGAQKAVSVRVAYFNKANNERRRFYVNTRIK